MSLLYSYITSAMVLSSVTLGYDSLKESKGLVLHCTTSLFKRYIFKLTYFLLIVAEQVTLYCE